jgi:hypothetical protein
MSSMCLKSSAVFAEKWSDVSYVDERLCSMPIYGHSVRVWSLISSRMFVQERKSCFTEACPVFPVEVILES